jgi:uncharacterized membrane protein YvbJ
MDQNSYYGGAVASNNTKNAGSRRKILIYMGVFLVVVTVIVGLLSAVTLSADRKVADSFVKAIVSGDTEKSYSLLSKKSQENDTKVQWKNKLKELKDYYKSADYKKTKVTIPKTKTSNGEQILIYQAIGKDNTKHLFNVVMVIQTDGKYTVSAFSAVTGVYSAKK